MDQPFEIDFSDLKSKAAAMLDGIDEGTPEVAPVVAEPVVEKVTAPVVAPVAKTTEPVATAPVVVDELDPEKDGDRLVRVKIDGQWEVKPLSEVTGGYSRTSHFTRQMQDLAAQRKEVETFQAERTSLLDERQKVSAFLANPQLVMKYLQQQNPQLFETAQQPVIGQPDEIATIQQAQDLIAAQARQMTQTLAEMEHNVNARIDAKTKELEDKRETAQHAEVLNATVKTIWEKFPILKSVRLAEDTIRYEVAKLNPKTIAEAQEAFLTVAQGMYEDLQDGFAQTNKLKVAAKQKLETKTIEPPGGSGPQIQPTNYKKTDGSVDWNKLKQMAADYSD